MRQYVRCLSCCFSAIVLTIGGSVLASGRRGDGDIIHSGFPPCDDKGVCDYQVGVTGSFAQNCPTGDDEWISFAFPVLVDNAVISAINMTHNTNDEGGDLYLLGDCNGNPDINAILYAGCEAIKPGMTGPQVYPVEPAVKAGGIVWAVAVFRSSFSFDVAFNQNIPDDSGLSEGLGFGNLSGSGACGEWSDLADFAFGFCYCVSITIEPFPTPCEGDVNGDGTVDPLDSSYVLSRLGCTVGSGDSECDVADANHDGQVDPLDSGYILSRFGACP